MDFRLDLCFEPLDFVFFKGKKTWPKEDSGYRRKEGRWVKNIEGNKDRKKKKRKKMNDIKKGKEIDKKTKRYTR